MSTDATTAPPAIPQSVIEITWGPYVTGIMLQQLFLGVVVVQVYDYYRIFPHDHIRYKGLVAVISALTLLQGIMDYINLYRCAVTGYGDFNVFDLQDWSLWWEIGVTAIIGSVAQGFFLERCWTATKNWFALVFGGVAILVSLASGLASTIEFQRVQRLSRVPEIPIPITLWLVSTAIIDMFLSLVLIWSLVRVKTNFLKTESVISRIIRLSFTTGSLTAAVAIVNVILYLALPGEAFHLLPQLSMGKIYAISVMVTLASRAELQEIMHAKGNATYVETTRAYDSKFDLTTARGRSTTGLGGIEVQTTVQVHDEHGNTVAVPAERKSRLGLADNKRGPTPNDIELGKVRSSRPDDQWSVSDSDLSGKAAPAAV